jgi:heat shock protein HslJ
MKMKPHVLRYIGWYLLLFIALAACGVIGLFGEGPVVDLRSMSVSSWVLHSFGPVDDLEPALPDSRVTLNFDFDHKTASGNAGCNHYSASFTLRGSSLSFEQLMSTLMACYPEEVMQQETLFTSLLGQVTSYRIEEDFLVLSTEDGVELLFQSAVD